MKYASLDEDLFASSDTDPYWEDEIDEILDELTEREMRDFLRTLANEDERIGRLIVNRFGTPDIAHMQTSLNADIDAIWSRYEYKGYIDYRKSSYFECDVQRAFLDAMAPLMRPATLREAFEVSYAFLLRLEDIDIDDSDGFFANTAGLCTDSWGKILSLAQQLESPDGGSIRRSVCNRLCSFVRANPVRDQTGVYSYLSDIVIDFLVKQFADDAELAGLLIELFDDKLTEAATPHASAAGLHDYEETRWASLRLQVMKAQGADERSGLDFAKPYMRHRIIRMAFVNDRHSRGDLDGAIALLLEGRSQADSPWEKTAFAEELAKLYEEAGLLDLACVEMRTLAVTARCFDGKGTFWFEKLKGLTPADEWPTLRDELLANITDTHHRRSCLAVEGLYAELMESIEAEGADRWYGSRLEETRRFRKELGPLFPERVAPIYREGVESLLVGYSTNRKTYQNAVKLMLEMAEANPEAATDLARWIRKTYPRRSALMDELQKAGW